MSEENGAEMTDQAPALVAGDGNFAPAGVSMLHGGARVEYLLHRTPVRRSRRSLGIAGLPDPAAR